MGGSDTPPPPVNEPGKDLQKYVSGLESVMPNLLNIERNTRPEFNSLNLSDIQNFLQGQGGQKGIIGLGRDATASAQDELATAKSAELGGMLGNAGAARDVTAAASPESASLVDAQTRMALDRYGAASRLSGQEKRLADQTARESFAARGRVNDNASVASEILGREEVMAAKRSEASQLGGQAFGMSNTYSEPTRDILGSSSPSVLLGQDYMNRASSSVGQSVPQLIDTGAGITLGQQNAQNLANWQGQVVAANNAESAQNTQLAASSAIALLSIFSDKRVKKDVKRVGKTDKGTPIYTYKYKGSEKPLMGVMAQDIEKEQPEALGPVIGGIKTVNYGKVR
jgi:hypothetical protein